MTEPDISPADMADLRRRAEETGRTLEQMKAVFRRFTGNGIAVIGDRVIYDGEAAALGVAPLKRWPPD